MYTKQQFNHWRKHSKLDKQQSFTKTTNKYLFHDVHSTSVLLVFFVCHSTKHLIHWSAVPNRASKRITIYWIFRTICLSICRPAGKQPSLVIAFDLRLLYYQTQCCFCGSQQSSHQHGSTYFAYTCIRLMSQWEDLAQTCDTFIK